MAWNQLRRDIVARLDHHKGSGFYTESHPEVELLTRCLRALGGQVEGRRPCTVEAVSTVETPADCTKQRIGPCPVDQVACLTPRTCEMFGCDRPAPHKPTDAEWADLGRAADDGLGNHID